MPHLSILSPFVPFKFLHCILLKLSLFMGGITTGLYIMVGVFFFAMAQSHAQSTPALTSIENDSATVSLIIPQQRKDEPTITVGLEFKLKPHWKIYWKNPGDAGYPPSVTIKDSKSQPIDDYRLLFPVPKSMELLGMHSYAYEQQVVFPITITTPKALQQQSPLWVTVDWLACNTLCVPHTATLPLSLNPVKSTPKVQAIIDTWIQKVPVPVNNPKGIKATLSANIGDNSSRQLRITTPPATDTFLYHDDFPSISPIIKQNNTDTTTFSYSLTGTINVQKPLFVTLIQNTKHGVKITENRVFISAPPYEKENSLSLDQSLLWIMIVAFFGGFILNFMPCVLPVLGIKALSFANSDNRSKARLSFAWVSVGIIGTFTAIGMGIYSLKSAGTAIGWGTHFQEPIFLWAMFIIISVFAFMLMFDKSIPLPKKIRELSPAHTTAMGGVFNGLLATLLSTPCSAPILGTAITLTMTMQGMTIPAIFTLMGLGMATPYIIIAILPQSFSILPKPGAWMNTFRRLMGGILAITALWLGGLAMNTLAPTSNDTNTTNQSQWRSFDPNDETPIHNAVKQGKVVVLDITADWCLTCKFNAMTTLDTQKSYDFYDENSVVLLRKDWTHKDDTVLPFLQKYGRSAIPFTVVFGPNAPQGIILGEVLTPNALRTAIKQAQ